MGSGDRAAPERVPSGGPPRPQREPGSLASSAPADLVDLRGGERESAIEVLIGSFTGIYRWHAKRTLRRIDTVRAAVRDRGIIGVSMLETLTPEVGYVYYIAVAPHARRSGVGGLLLDDALARFRAGGSTVVYAAVVEGNAASQRLFRSRGFRPVDRHEPDVREGGLGARGLRGRMMVVSGEVLLGLRLGP